MSREPMWTLLILWLVRGGPAMSDTRPAPTNLPTTQHVFPPRTIHDVEAEMYQANSLIVERRARQNDKSKFLERIDGLPALLVQEVNFLHDEWALMRAEQTD